MMSKKCYYVKYWNSFSQKWFHSIFDRQEDVLEYYNRLTTKLADVDPSELYIEVIYGEKMKIVPAE